MPLVEWIEKTALCLSKYLIIKDILRIWVIHVDQRQGNRVYIKKTLAVQIIDSKIIFFQLIVQSHPSDPKDLRSL